MEGWVQLYTEGKRSRTRKAVRRRNVAITTKPRLERLLEPGSHYRFNTGALQLGDVGVEKRADRAKCLIQITGQAAHPSRSCEGNQGEDQQVLDQPLALLVLVQ